MAQERASSGVAERRCPNCGTRVAPAQKAVSCAGTTCATSRSAAALLLAGYRARPRRPRRAVLLVAHRHAVLGRRRGPGPGRTGTPPTSIPLLAATPTPPPTPTPLPTPTPVPVTQQTVLVKHVVEDGETLLSIAIDYDVSVEEIQRANNLSSELIRVGDELGIPVVRDVGGTIEGAPPNNFEYIVLQGDTLISISLMFGSTVEDIQVANNLAANAIIRPGDKLLVPVSGAPPEALAVTPEPAPGVPRACGGFRRRATAAPAYGEPRLISPPSGVAIPRTDSVSLQWISVDVLKPNEWYVVQILPRSPNARALPTVWTRETSFRLGAEYAPPEGQLADYDWLISVVRVKSGSEGAALEAASPPSEIRRFTWK